MSGSQQFSDNWACNLIKKSARDKSKDAKYILQQLSTHPKTVAAVQEVLDWRNDENYDPDNPGGEPADGIINAIVAVLTEAPTYRD
jgi:hypothetical protein